jgi:hypothetical protein
MNDVTGADLLKLLVLALPVAAISWAFTHEEVFREVHNYCVGRSRISRRLPTRKFFYLLTCAYCFSHYVSAAMLAITGFTLLYTDWRGYLIAWLALVWVANHLISLYGRLRLGIRSERLEIGLKEAVSAQAGVARQEDRSRPQPERRRAG